MDELNIVMPPGQAPGRSFSLKLRSGETGDSIMMFEEAIPVGTKARSTCIATVTRWLIS